MKPGLWEAVMQRDRRCVLSFLEEGHVCQTVFRREHAPDDIKFLTVEHVKPKLRMGKRADDDLAQMVALCGFANNRPPTKAQRELMRAYLAEHYGISV
jgi:hypothetical protein